MAGSLTWQELERQGLTDCDPRDRESLDPQIFGGVFSDHDPGQAVDWLRQTLAHGEPWMCEGFARELRCAIADVRYGLRFPYGEGLPEPQDIHRLRDSVREAIACITAWIETHGIEYLDTPEGETAAQRGWPDAAGKGWTPPWDILGIEQPSWWAGAEKSRTEADAKRDSYA